MELKGIEGIGLIGLMAALPLMIILFQFRIKPQNIALICAGFVFTWFLFSKEILEIVLKMNGNG